MSLFSAMCYRTQYEGFDFLCLNYSFKIFLFLYFNVCVTADEIPGSDEPNQENENDEDENQNKDEDIIADNDNSKDQDKEINNQQAEDKDEDKGMYIRVHTYVLFFKSKDLK